MTLSDYRDKRFLIIDSLKPSRDLLKQFAFDLNAETVEAVGYANDVIQRCSENHYDILLLGYDLGDSQKNGQQLLEELKTSGLIDRQTIVILITAENSQAMVLAALEHKPDDYLTKPYRIQDLLTRLERCYRKKHHMRDVYQALDQNDAYKAIALCEQAIQDGSPYRTECFGIKSRQLFELEQYDEASRIYNRFIDVKGCQWASIGLGKIALKRNKVKDAILRFQSLIKTSPLYLSSYDWLATSYETINQMVKAEEVLEIALTISPYSIKRLERYAKLCYDNGNFEKATKAYEHNYQFSFNSIHHKPANAFNYSSALNELAPQLSDYQLKLQKSRVTNALSETAKTFNNLDTRLQAQLHTVRLMRKTREEYDAKRLLQSCEKQINKQADNLESSTLVDLSKLLIDLNRQATASNLISKVVVREPDNLTLMSEVDQLIDTQLQSEEQKQAQKVLNNATSHYRQHRYKDALKDLNQAIAIYPNHIGIKLNLIQVLLTLFEQDQRLTKYKLKAQELLASLTGLPNDHHGYHRYQLLNQKLNALTRSY
ncbi:response regulator [Colwellia sp. MEBiC06753]